MENLEKERDDALARIAELKQRAEQAEAGQTRFREALERLLVVSYPVYQNDEPMEPDLQAAFEQTWWQCKAILNETHWEPSLVQEIPEPSTTLGQAEAGE